MTLRNIADLLNATVITGEQRLDEEVNKAFASDLMSDVLTLSETPLLIAGLCNVQTIRTCDMAGIDMIVLVRDKTPTPDMVKEAGDNGMVLLCTPFSMFRTCGILFSQGLDPVY